jgi:hypothetical protein
MDTKPTTIEELMKNVAIGCHAVIETKIDNCTTQCANYLNDKFDGPDCNGCTLNPFYMNNFVQKEQ